MSGRDNIRGYFVHQPIIHKVFLLIAVEVRLVAAVAVGYMWSGGRILMT